MYQFSLLPEPEVPDSQSVELPAEVDPLDLPNEVEWSDALITNMRIAFLDMTCSTVVNKNTSPRSRALALEWIMDNALHPFCFRVCCAELRVDHAEFRDLLMGEYADSPLLKLESSWKAPLRAAHFSCVDEYSLVPVRHLFEDHLNFEEDPSEPQYGLVF